MFSSKWCVFPVVVVLAAGCGGTPDGAPAPAIDMSAADNLIPGQLARGAALQTEIRSAGHDCNRVTKTFLQGMKDGDEVWDAQCEGGESYGVISKAGGDTEVLTCDAVERQTGTSCFEKF